MGNVLRELDYSKKMSCADLFAVLLFFCLKTIQNNGFTKVKVEIALCYYSDNKAQHQ